MAVQRCRREPGWSLSQLCLPFRMHFYPQVDCLMATKQAQQLQASCLFQSAMRKKRKSLIKQPSHTVPVASTPLMIFTYTPLARREYCSLHSQLEEAFWMAWGCGRGLGELTSSICHTTQGIMAGPGICTSPTVLDVAKVDEPIYRLANKV